MAPNLRRLMAGIGLVLMAASLSGCIVYDRDGCGGWWHHCR